MSSPLFKRGYDGIEKQIASYRSPKYIMSCDSCIHFYKAEGDDEELCQNPEVTQYDLVTTESSVSCFLWKFSKETKHIDSKNTDDIMEQLGKIERRVDVDAKQDNKRQKHKTRKRSSK